VSLAELAGNVGLEAEQNCELPRGGAFATAAKAPRAMVPTERS